MDKQKQIEEIADALYNSQYEYDLSNPFEVAKVVIGLGYRKIPKNAVVLTREELADMKFTQEHCDLYLENKWLKECIPLARKETVEKFAEYVKIAFYYEFDELIPSIMADKIDEIAREITGGEKEISNETV